MSLGDYSIADLRAMPDVQRYVDLLERLTGLSSATVRERLANRHGRTKVCNAFEEEWPRAPEQLGGFTVALAKEAQLHDEIRQVLIDGTATLVTRRLNEATGNALVRNIFASHWPEKPTPPRPSETGGAAAVPPKSAAVRVPAPAPSAPGAPGPSEVSSEVEDEDTSSTITRPFDPGQIRVRLWTPTVDLLMRRLESHELDVAPDFQRHAGVWKDGAQSKLIESLLIRIPLPAFYFDGANEDRLIVVDGIQRLTALRRFLNEKTLRLTNLEYLTDLAGKSADELPRPLVRRLEETMLTVYVIEKGTPEAAKLNIFKRLNTGGEPLTPQEIRHAMNPGPVRDFLKALAAEPSFIDATQAKFTDNRMTDRECALRFCAFKLVPPDQYPTDGDLDNFLHAAMRRINQLEDVGRDLLAERFRRAMGAAQLIMGDDAFRKPKRSGTRSRVNKALFEAWAIGLDGCSNEGLARLQEARGRLLEDFAQVYHSNRDFDQALSQGTGDTRKVRLRFSVIRALLERYS
jgi:hypothetical protein